MAVDKDQILTGLDPEQFALVYKYLFNIDGTLNDIGKIYNEAFKVETIASYLQGQKEANKSLESQIRQIILLIIFFNNNFELHLFT